MQPSVRFRRAAAPMLAAIVIGACTDQRVLLEPTAAPARSVGSQPAEWKGYWRNANELWVYDMTPEIGLNSSYGGHDHISRISNAGMRLVRHPMWWSTMDTIGWQFSAALNIASQYGAEYMLVVHGPKNHVMQSQNPSGATDRNAIYQLLATDIVKMMDWNPSLKFYQLFNEVDAGCENAKFFNGHTSGYGTALITDAVQQRYIQGRNYADMLKVVYPAMKAKAAAQNRQVWVVTAGFTGQERIHNSSSCAVSDDYISWEFIRGMYDNGGGPYFDILAMHAYGPTAWSPRSMSDRTH
jgi:hypothetical protein